MRSEPRLHRQVQVRHELRHARVRVDQPRRELLRMRRRVADALDAGDLGDVFEQRREVGDVVGDVAASASAAIRVDVLAEQRDLAHALVGQAGDLGQHVVERRATPPRRACTARRRSCSTCEQPSMIDTNAVAPSTRAGGRWSNFSISGKRMSTCGSPLARRAAISSRQAMQRLRAEHDVDVRRARRRSPRLPGSRRSRRRR